MNRRHWQGSADAIIVVKTTTNPKRAGSKARERFAIYRTGMTVGEYVRRCELEAVPRPKDALLDIAWDVEHGFIELEIPSSS